MRVQRFPIESLGLLGLPMQQEITPMPMSAPSVAPKASWRASLFDKLVP